MLFYLPLLVGIVQVAAPLQDTSFHSTIPTVIDSLLRERTDNTINVFLYRDELPYLRFFSRYALGNEYLGAGIHAFLIVHCKTVQSVYFVCLIGIYGLCCNINGAKEKQTGQDFLYFMHNCFLI